MSLEVLATTLLPRLTARLPGAGGVARIETIRLIKDAEAMHNLLFDQLTDQPMSI